MPKTDEPLTTSPAAATGAAPIGVDSAPPRGQLTTFDEGGALDAPEPDKVRRRRGRPPQARARVVHRNTPITTSEMAFLRAVVQGVEPRDAALQYLPGDEHQDGRAARPFLRQLLDRLQDAAKRPELGLHDDTVKAILAEIEVLRKRAADPPRPAPAAVPAPEDATAGAPMSVPVAKPAAPPPAPAAALEPDSPTTAGSKLPTLDEYASQFPEDMYGQAELMEMYLEEYPQAREDAPAPHLEQLASLVVATPAPTPAPAPPRSPGLPTVAAVVALAAAPPAPRHKLQVDARLAMLDQLTPLVAVVPGPEAPLPLWLGEKLGASLRASQGLTTLAQLAAFINAAGNRWYEQVPGLGRARALRLVAWLWQHEEAIGVRLRDRPLALVQASARAAQPPARSDTHQSLALRPPGRELALAREVAQSYALVPLDEFYWPDPLLGAQCRFRGGAINTFEAQDDRQALRAWFDGTVKKRSPATQEVNRRAIERLVLWALLERRAALSSLSAVDLNGFVAFLYDPPDHWCSTERVLRVSKDWRPLRGPLDEHSVRQIVIVVRQLYAAWHAAGYLAMNSAHGLSFRRERDAAQEAGAPPPAQDAQSMDVGRSFAEQDLQAIKRELEAMPDDEFRRRLRAILSLFVDMGLRRAEVDRLTLGTPEPVRLANVLTDIMKMRVIGKGNKARDIPVMGTTLDALEEHYADRMRLIREGKLPANYAAIAREQTPVLSILREGRKAHVAGPGLTPADAPRDPNLTGRLASGSIAIILKEFFGRVALRPDVRERQAHFEAASAHWLRHTFAHRVLATGQAQLPTLQKLLGHRDISTTGIYVEADMEDRVRAVAAVKPVF